MKKFMVLAMAVIMVAGFFGTASAVDYAVRLNTGLYYTPLVASGSSVYVLGSGSGNNGATLFQLNPTSSTATSGYITPAWNLTLGGASVFVAPAIYQASGESGVTLVVQAKDVPNTANGTNLDYLGGTSLYAFSFSPTNGSGSTSFNISLAYRSGASSYTSILPNGAVNDPSFFSAVSSWGTHLLIDSATTGTTVYGTTGVSVVSGSSIWAVGLGTVASGAGRLSSNQFSATLAGSYGVSSYATPLSMTGNSIFAIGEWNYGTSSGASIIMFDKGKLNEGRKGSATLYEVNASGVNGLTPFPTPAIAGNSLFVVDHRGGLTAYSIQPTNLLPTTRVANDFAQLGNSLNTAVTASPVTNGTFLAVAVNHTSNANAGAGITVFRISDKRIAGTSGTSWWYEWPAGTTVAATPVISNGNLYVAVNTANDGAAFYRFALSQATGGRIAQVNESWTSDASGANFGFIDLGGMIISGNRLIAITDSATSGDRLYSIDVSSSANSNPYWLQFKADAAKTGENTAAAAVVTPTAGDSDSGCFISTIK